MKARHIINLLLLLTCFPLFGQNQSDPFVTSVNEAWVAKNYNAISHSIENAIQHRPTDITVLYAAYNFYLMVQPNLAKLSEVAGRIKVRAEAVNKLMLNEISKEIQEGLPALTQEGLQTPSQAWFEVAHKTWKNEFPLMSLGIRLQAITQN